MMLLMVLSLSVSYLFFYMITRDLHRFAHGDAAYKTKILRYELENLNQLVGIVDIANTVKFYFHLPFLVLSS